MHVPIDQLRCRLQWYLPFVNSCVFAFDNDECDNFAATMLEKQQIALGRGQTAQIVLFPTSSAGKHSLAFVVTQDPFLAPLADVLHGLHPTWQVATMDEDT
eukprot:TRINITY_DN1489_c0_g1_i2.p6 TRINITY_DN1489_c0_g1~~TRINITY_DN1489_c0_g1_i2.p6  ORF type:complete len:101 (+),score=4.05 TRINITY_DN1489_c0_g1_i2:1044-1346(+)